ncbi:uncharacterized protein [Primulina eburnea]|uniref:uncharacterized protein isoform X1 n=1 Tax=Primulina eburnea TaxID=1245227 RepID=UPI003C6C6487
MLVLNSGKLDIDYFGKILEYALIILQKLSAPTYQNELKEKRQKFMAELAETRWANDSSGYSNIITLIKGTEARNYQSTYKNAGTILKGTRGFIFSWKIFHSRDEELNDHQKSISELTTGQESLSNYIRSATLLTGGNFLVKMGGKQVEAFSTSNATNYLETVELEHNQEEVDLLVRLSLLKLVRQITGLIEGELPETVTLNLFRLRSV